MKKLLCIALFSIAILANANNKKEFVENTTDEKELVTNNSTETVTDNYVVNIEDSDFEKETFDDDFFGCGSQANAYYDELMATGNYTHREARSLRRDWVRDCRGGPWMDWPWE